MLVVHQLARVLLDMDALDADRLVLDSRLLVEPDLDRALADQRVIELGDLITLRQIRVEVILAVEPAQRLISASSAMPVRTAWRMHSRLGTGSMPGIAASTRLTWVLGSAPNAVAAPEKSLALRVTWAWTSRPITTSHSPVSPWMR